MKSCKQALILCTTIIFCALFLPGCGDKNKTDEESAEGLLPVVEKYSGKYDRNTIAHRVTLINDTSSPKNTPVVDHPLYSDDWYDDGDVNNVHIIGKSQIFLMDDKLPVSGNSSMYLMKNRFRSKIDGNTQTILMNGYDKSTGKKLLFKVMYLPGKTKTLLERTATITVQDIATKEYLVEKGTWLFANTKYIGDGSNPPEAGLFALKGTTDENMLYVAAEMMFYIVTGQKYFGDCDPYASSGSVNAGDDYVYSNFLTQDLYDRCDGKGPFDQAPDFANATMNNYPFRNFKGKAITALSMGNVAEEFISLGDAESVVAKKIHTAPKTLGNGVTQYDWHYCTILVKNGKVQMLRSMPPVGETPMGIGNNGKIDKVLSIYGKGYVKSYYRGRDLYEYKTSAQDGQIAIIRFAIDPVKQAVDYVAMYYLNGDVTPDPGIVFASQKELTLEKTTKDNGTDKKSASSVVQTETKSDGSIKVADSPYIQDGLWQGNANQIVLDMDERHKEVTVIDKSTAKIIDVKGRDVLSIKMNGFSLKTGESKWEDVMYFDVTDENNVGYSTGHEINTGWRPLKDLHSESLERAYKIGAEVVGL